MKSYSNEIKHGMLMKQNHRMYQKQEQKMNHYDLFTLHLQLRRMNHVTRMAGTAKIKNYSLTEHCYHTGLLFKDISNQEGIQINMEQLDWVLRHDLFETITGDVLYPTKNHSEITKKNWDNIERELSCSMKYKKFGKYTDTMGEQLFDELSWKLFKCCDILELYMFVLEERKLGNNSDELDEIRNKCISILNKYRKTFPTIDHFLLKSYGN